MLRSQYKLFFFHADSCVIVRLSNSDHLIRINKLVLCLHSCHLYLQILFFFFYKDLLPLFKYGEEMVGDRKQYTEHVYTTYTKHSCSTLLLLLLLLLLLGLLLLLLSCENTICDFESIIFTCTVIRHIHRKSCICQFGSCLSLSDCDNLRGNGTFFFLTPLNLPPKQLT